MDSGLICVGVLALFALMSFVMVIRVITTDEITRKRELEKWAKRMKK